MKDMNIFNQKDMKDIVVSLKREELTYSIDYLTYKVAKVHFSESSPKVAVEVASTPSDKDYVDELIASGIENVRNELRWCVEKRNRVAGTDIVCPACETYDIVLHLADDSRVDPQILGRMIHNYLVYYVAYRYLLLSAPGMAGSFASLSEAALNKVYMHVREEQPSKPVRGIIS